MYLPSLLLSFFLSRIFFSFFFIIILPLSLFFFFFFNDTATTEIYTLSLHDALPISCPSSSSTPFSCLTACQDGIAFALRNGADRKSTRLNSSHLVISYAVFCLKKKKK